MTLEDLMYQLTELTRGGNFVLRQIGPTILRMSIFTDRHEYVVSGYSADPEGSRPEGYLGATFSCRRPCAGEGHLRGGDLPDGPLDVETWNKIVFAIAKNEIVTLGSP